MVRKTRKLKKGKQQKEKPLTIPELRGAFDTIDKKVEKLRGLDKQTQISEFKKSWKSIFGRDVSHKAVEAYLHVKLSENRSKKATRKMKQKGGAMPLAGAPLDYQLRPGIDGPYGNYPAYVEKGLTFYDSINQIGMKAECGVKDFTPTIPKDMGSNQAGGADPSLRDFASAMTFKPFDSTVPSSVFQDMRTAYLGKDLPPSPAVEDAVWKYK